MTITETKEENNLILSLSGDLDLLGGPELTSYLAERFDDIPKLTLNFHDIYYMSSAGIRSILIIKKGLGDKEMKIINCNSIVYDVFDLTGLCEVLDIEKEQI